MISPLELYIIAFFFGVTNKLADLMNEHGLFWFRGGDSLFGLVWGLLGLPLVMYNEYMAAAYIALIMQWHLELKLDNFNHALAGTIILIGGLIVANTSGVPIDHVIALVAAYYLTWLLQSNLKGISKGLDFFIRLRTRIYLIPLLYAWYVGQWEIFFTTVIAMIGVEIITLYYKFIKGID